MFPCHNYGFIFANVQIIRYFLYLRDSVFNVHRHTEGYGSWFYGRQGADVIIFFSLIFFLYSRVWGVYLRWYTIFTDENIGKSQ
ncbi:hypothetical protein PBCV1_a052R [Paramecium bursaria Chlorella virus 1]|uniref:Uncharacterized protein n=1 Tax=Paramecium bursaria Chlorella virus 1 TaxID=10506 RepID=Q89387_PBCV1|nr:hypothetical protein PBCV1_a052R [Paramecium bursaria Chlorella virus 1]AAC96420.1 hypothetical protein [Paramecium bursaria Chlorella virus 1]